MDVTISPRGHDLRKYILIFSNVLFNVQSAIFYITKIVNSATFDYTVYH